MCQRLRDVCSSPMLWRKACQKEPRFPMPKLAGNKRLERRTAADYWRLSYRLFYSSRRPTAYAVICPGCLRTVAVASQDHAIVPLCLLWK